MQCYWSKYKALLSDEIAIECLIYWLKQKALLLDEILRNCGSDFETRYFNCCNTLI